MNINTKVFVPLNVSIMIYRNGVISLLLTRYNPLNRLSLALIYPSNQLSQRSDLLKLSPKIKAYVPNRCFIPSSGSIPVQQL